ncbi:MAG: plasmid mobilization protein [Lachnospiraceae bacterium]
MPDNRNWNRPTQVKFFVDERELGLIKARMAQLGIENMSAYLRKMAINGYEEKPDLSERREPNNP